jgi:hypothetical protein
MGARFYTRGMVMMIADYIQVYDVLSEEEDIEKLRVMAKYLLVGRAMNDSNVSEEEAIALAEYSSIDIGMINEEIVIH